MKVLVRGLLEIRSVIGNDPLDFRRKIEDDARRQGDHRASRRDPDPALPLPIPLDALGHAPSGEGEEEEGNGDPDGEGNRQRHGFSADSPRRARHADRREHRSRAWNVGGSQHEAEDESVGPLVHLFHAYARERLLQPFLDLWDHKRDPDEREKGDACPPNEILGKPQKAEDSRSEQSHGRKGDDQPERDEEGVFSRRRLAVGGGAGRAREEDDGEHRQYARRYARDQAAEQADENLREHGFLFTAVCLSPLVRRQRRPRMCATVHTSGMPCGAEQ